MTTLPAPHRRFPFLNMPDVFADFPRLAPLRAFAEPHLIRVEEEVADGRYIVRAELPGVDPAKDIAVTVENGMLSIQAERSEEKKESGRSEFSYGSFRRVMRLPAGAQESDVKASYDKGILSVSVAVDESAPGPRKIEIT